MHSSSLLLIPTLVFATASWDAMLSELPRDIGTRTVALPGHGEPSSPDDWDLVALTDELAGWVAACPQPPHLVGSGAGALVAEHLARRLPAASLTVIGWPPDQRPGEMDQRIAATRLALADADEHEFFAAYRAGAAPRAETESIAAPVSAAGFLAGLEIAARWTATSLSHALPVTLIRGAGDQRCRSSDARALAGLWQADLREVPGAGHATYVDAPGDVARILLDVIKSAERAPGPFA